MTMFTPGFRLFFGLAIATTTAAVVFGLASGDGSGLSLVGVMSLGWKGGVGSHVGYITLVMAALAAGFLAFIVTLIRDADPEAVAELAPDGQVPAVENPQGYTFWPAVGAFGLGVLIIGLVTHAALFIAGIVILGVVVLEWMVAAWADRVSADPVANRAVRDQIIGPMEIPVLGTAGVALVVLAFSRVLLAVSEAWAVWIAVGVAAAIMAVAVLVALIPKPEPSMVAAIVLVGALAFLVAGIVAASVGERDFHHGADHEGAIAVAVDR